MSRVMQTQVLVIQTSNFTASFYLIYTTAVHLGNRKFTDMLTPAHDLTHLV